MADPRQVMLDMRPGVLKVMDDLSRSLTTNQSTMNYIPQDPMNPAQMALARQTATQRPSVVDMSGVNDVQDTIDLAGYFYRTPAKKIMADMNQMVPTAARPALEAAGPAAAVLAPAAAMAIPQVKRGVMKVMPDAAEMMTRAASGNLVGMKTEMNMSDASYYPPHGVRDEAKLNSMVEALKRGEKLPRIIASGDYAFSGSHRIAAWDKMKMGHDAVELTDDEYVAVMERLGLDPVYDSVDDFDQFIEAARELNLIPDDAE